MSAAPVRPAPSRKDPGDKDQPLALFGCTHGELYVPPLPLAAPAPAAQAADGSKKAPSPLALAPTTMPPQGSFAALASRMRAMGWKVDLLVDLERQLLPPPPLAKPTTTTTTIAVLGAPSRSFSQGELRALRRFLLERGGRLWLLAEGADPSSSTSTRANTTNLWRRLTGPLMGIEPRTGEAVVRLAPWPTPPPLLVRAAAAALEVAAMAEEEQEEEQRDDGDKLAANVRRAAASLRRVRRAAATSGLCLHPRHALVEVGGRAAAAGATAKTTPTMSPSPTILNRSVARAFLDDEADDDDDEPDTSFVFANGCPLDVFVDKAGAGVGTGAAAAGPPSAAAGTPLLASGRHCCYPADRPLMAAWEQDGGGGGGRALVVGSAAMFSDAWIGSCSSSSSSSSSNNRCEGNRRLADWSLRWLAARACSSSSSSKDDKQQQQHLDAADGVAARAALGVAREGGGGGGGGGGAGSKRSTRGYRRPPHALLPAVGALAARCGIGGGGGGGGGTGALPAMSLPPAAALRGDWRAMLDQAAFDGGWWQEEGGDEGAALSSSSSLAAAALLPLS